MKKKVTIILLTVFSLFLLCSCAEKTSDEPETVTLTYADIYEANTYSAITSNYNTILMKDNELIDGEYIEYEYYWNASSLVFKTSPYVDDEGNLTRNIVYIADEGSYLYFMPITAEEATFDIFEYYTGSAYATVEDMAIFGMTPPEYNQTITECKKVDNGYEITGENSDPAYVAMFRSVFFSDGEYKDGDKIMFRSLLNEKYEMLEYENNYVFADGSETVKTNYGEFVYGINECPDFAKNVNSILEKGAKDISVNVYTENGVLERKVYSDIFLLHTDYEVYSDTEYTNLLSGDNGYYVFDTSDDINVYLKTPTTE